MGKFILRSKGISNRRRSSLNISNTNTEMNNKIFTPLNNTKERNIINKWEKITGRDDIIISFVSDPIGTSFYSEKFPDLVSKVDLLGYDYIFFHYESDRNYFQNCCYKPYFIKTIFETTGKNILWIDGDTFLKKDLNRLMDKNKLFDLGLVSYTNSMGSFVASPLYLKNTPITGNIIKSWETHCSSKIQQGLCELDHDALKHNILPLFKHSVKINLCGIDFHNGENLKNINSEVPDKVLILQEMRQIHNQRPFPGNTTDYIIV